MNGQEDVVPGARYRRSGRVTARRLDAPMTWAIDGQQLQAQAGDWLVSSAAGGTRTVADEQFRATHEHVSGDVWSRIGEVTAVRLDATTEIETLEGVVVASPGDWLLRTDDGARWPVPDEVFRRTYAPVTDGPGARP